jgi:hypothetical protein
VKLREILLVIRMGNNLLDKTPIAQETKAKNAQMMLPQTKMHLHSKGNNWQSEKTTHRRIETVCYLAISKVIMW